MEAAYLVLLIVAFVAIGVVAVYAAIKFASGTWFGPEPGPR